MAAKNTLGRVAAQMRGISKSFLLLWALCLPAYGVEVLVDPGSYSGLWKINGVNEYRNGVATLDIAPGDYDLWVGGISRLSVHVDASGNITSSNEDAVLGGPAKIEFQSLPISILAGDYQGLLMVGHVTDYYSGDSLVSLVPGLSYTLYIAARGLVNFSVAANGDISSANADAAQGGAMSLTLNTVDVAIDPGSYNGNWVISHVNNFESGQKTFRLVPGLPYLFYVGYAGQFEFNANQTGLVSPSNTNAASGGPNSLSLNSTSVSIDAGDYAGNWKIGHIDEFAPGSRALSLVPGLDYTGCGASRGSFRMQVDGQGQVSSSNIVAATGGAGSLRFSTAPVYIDPLAMPGTWRVIHVNDFASGPRSLALVRGLKYELFADFGESTQITIDALGKIAEGQVSLGAFALNFTPPPPPPAPDTDQDNDGVYDENDLCADTTLRPKVPGWVNDEGCSKKQERELERAEKKAARELAQLEREKERARLLAEKERIRLEKEKQKELERLRRLAEEAARKALLFKNRLP